MKYLLIAYRDEPQLESVSTPGRSQIDAFCQACRTNDDALRENGYLIGAVHLQGKSATATARLQNNVLSFTDGPLIEMGEPLDALYFINARDFNEAVRLASTMPQLRRGPIEVRSMAEFDWPFK